MRDFAIMVGERVWRSLGGIVHSVRTGEPAFDTIFGAQVFEHHAQNPDAERCLAAGMTSRSGVVNAAIVSAYDFAGATRVVDVAGGAGSLLREVLGAHPALRGVLFDLPSVVPLARERFAGSPELGRCEFVAGDFFTAVPSGDVLLLKKIIHDWPDEDAAAILRTCRAVLPDHGRVLLLEEVVPPSLTNRRRAGASTDDADEGRTRVAGGIAALERVLPTFTARPH